MLIAWIPATLWLAVITTESTKTFSGNNTLAWLLKLLRDVHIHASFGQAFYLNMILRKAGHFTGYAILSWLTFRGWMEMLAYQNFARFRQVVRRWRLRASALAVLCTIVVAGLDEFHQSFLPGRTGVVRDVILDSMGGVFVQSILLLYWTRNSRKTEKADVPVCLE